jgi:Putative Ig domain
MHHISAMTGIRRRITLGRLLLASLLLVSCSGGGGSSATPPPMSGAPSDLHYPTPPAFAINMAITPLTPTVVGEVSSYSVNPALPEGLSLNTASGVIWGIPTSVAAKANYTVKAANAAGSTVAIVSITVTAATGAPSNLQHPTPHAFVVGTVGGGSAPSSVPAYLRLAAVHQAALESVPRYGSILRIARETYSSFSPTGAT